MTAERLLVGGLGWPYDELLAASITANVAPCSTIGALDGDALDRGRAALPRGQCAPALYTTGALLRTAKARDERATYLALGSCGPCRFNMFDSMWRRALAQGGHTHVTVRGVASSLESLIETLGPAGAAGAIDAILAADGLAETTRRLRPYARDPDEVDARAREAAHAMAKRIAEGARPVSALGEVRGWHADIARADVSPLARIALVGEPWSLHVEGDPQLDVTRVLAHARVEVEAPPLALWLAYMSWTSGGDAWVAERVAEVARAAGLTGFGIPSIEDLAKLAAQHLPPSIRGGYGHVEIGLALRAVRDRRAHAIVSVKSFGCMPSAGITDAILPAALGDVPYLALEVSGDGEAARESRLALRVGAARALAEAELAEARRRRPGAKVPELDPLADPWFSSRRTYACTLANAVAGT